MTARGLLRETRGMLTRPALEHDRRMSPSQRLLVSPRATREAIPFPFAEQGGTRRSKVRTDSAPEGKTRSEKESRNRSLDDRPDRVNLWTMT